MITKETHDFGGFLNNTNPVFYQLNMFQHNSNVFVKTKSY